MKLGSPYLSRLTCVFAFSTLTLWAGPAAPPVTVTGSSDFIVSYDGYGGAPPSVISGLTASTHFYNFVFTTGASNQVQGAHTFDASGWTNVQFDVDIANTSTAPITGARISNLSFITDPNLVNEATDTAKKKFNPNTLSAIYDTVDCCDVNVPNIGVVEFCFSDVNCAGGGGGGVTTTGSLTASLWFLGSNLTSINFQNLFVRYQSITGAGSITSAVGRPIPLSDDPVVPEPSFYGLLGAGLACLFWASRRYRQV